MSLVGNDIVDLKSADAKGKAGDLRFVERVLTSDEQAALRCSAFPDALLWAFWAAKEAAYKAVSKAVPGISSAPRRYPVAIDPHNLPEAPGFVQTPNGRVPVRILFGNDYVHCIASADRSRALAGIVHRQVQIVPDAKRESAMGREAAGSEIADFLNLAPESIRISRKAGPNPGPPAVYVDGKIAPIDLSLSHDGRFVAFAFRVVPGHG